MERSQGFPPLARSDARILILGSLPGQRSIAEQQYYAHPKNTFWPIMKSLFGIDGEYRDRLQQLLEHRIALWDVLHSATRPGSLDASIAIENACVNDFDAFFEASPEIRLVAFNGQKAGQLFRKLVDLASIRPEARQTVLPSTSPAYAAMPFSGKLARWRHGLTAASDDSTGGS